MWCLDSCLVCPDAAVFVKKPASFLVCKLTTDQTHAVAVTGCGSGVSASLVVEDGLELPVVPVLSK